VLVNTPTLATPATCAPVTLFAVFATATPRRTESGMDAAEMDWTLTPEWFGRLTPEDAAELFADQAPDVGEVVAA